MSATGCSALKSAACLRILDRQTTSETCFVDAGGNEEFLNLPVIIFTVSVQSWGQFRSGIGFSC